MFCNTHPAVIEITDEPDALTEEEQRKYLGTTISSEKDFSFTWFAFAIKNHRFFPEVSLHKPWNYDTPSRTANPSHVWDRCNYYVSSCGFDQIRTAWSVAHGIPYTPKYTPEQVQSPDYPFLLHHISYLKTILSQEIFAPLRYCFLCSKKTSRLYKHTRWGESNIKKYPDESADSYKVRCTKGYCAQCYNALCEQDLEMIEPKISQ